MFFLLLTFQHLRVLLLDLVRCSEEVSIFFFFPLMLFKPPHFGKYLQIWHNLEAIILTILHRTGYFRDSKKLCTLFRCYEKDMKVTDFKEHYLNGYELAA